MTSPCLRIRSRYAWPAIALAAVVVGFPALAGATAASRVPSKAEAGAIRRSVGIYAAAPGSPVGKKATVVAIDVSTVDGRYAGVRLASKARGRTVMVLHHSFGVWWLQQAGASIGCDTAPRAVLEDLKIACRGPNGVAWISDCSRLESKPASIVISCADGNYALLGLRWQRWGTATATASGTARVNDCVPYCARGHFHNYPVRASASGLTRCGATPDYGQLTVAYVASRPRFLPWRDRHLLGC